MNDARLVSHDVLGDEFASSIALATFENKGMAIWKKDCVLLCANLDEKLQPSQDTLFIIWAAGDLKKISSAIVASGARYIVFQRELNRKKASSRFRKWEISKALKYFSYDK